MSIFTQKETEQIYASSKCRCGEIKYSGRFFCIGCFLELPEDIQKGLYRNFGLGKEELFEKAFEFLSKQGVKNIYRTEEK